MWYNDITCYNVGRLLGAGWPFSRHQTPPTSWTLDTGWVCPPDTTAPSLLLQSDIIFSHVTLKNGIFSELMSEQRCSSLWMNYVWWIFIFHTKSNQSSEGRARNEYIRIFLQSNKLIPVWKVWRKSWDALMLTRTSPSRPPPPSPLSTCPNVTLGLSDLHLLISSI